MTLTEPLLAQAAGWEAMKLARALLAADKVLSSESLADPGAINWYVDYARG